VLAQFDSFAQVVRSNLAEADLKTRVTIIRLLIKRIEVGPQDVRIVYKIGSLSGEEDGIASLQDCSKREEVGLP